MVPKEGLSMAGSRREFAVVVRFTRYEGVDPSDCVSLMSVFADPAEADAEAARLNEVRRDDGVHYFVKMLLVRRPNGERLLP
jgi:hypothetical protein